MLDTFTKQQKSDAIKNLLELLQPGTKIYYHVDSVAATGMSRNMSFYVVNDGEIRRITHLIAQLGIGSYRRDAGNLHVSGCGMNMGFSVVYDVGATLFPNGFGVPCRHCGKRKANPAQRYGSHNCTHEYRGRNGDTSGWDDDGGYALDYAQL